MNRQFDSKAPKRTLEEPSEIETKMSYVDGVQGRLFYRGIDVRSLTEYSSYEEVSYLLLFGVLPNKKQLNEFSHRMATNRRIPAGAVTLIGSLPRSALPMDVLRTTISAMAMFDPKPRENRREELLDVAIDLITQTPTIVTAHNHIRHSRLPIEPDPTLRHAANFLYMLRGSKPEEYEAKVLDTCWVLHADHGLNPSTFAARVTASAQSDIYSALTTAIGTLKGTIHGGANQKVMEMLLGIRDNDKVNEYIKDHLRRGMKIPGFGHRIYKGEDPRVAHLRNLSQSICQKTNNDHWFELSRKVEQAVSGERELHPNMDFYSATIYYALGIPVDMLTTMFACSRLVGWAGHIIEQYELNKLIRPLGDYVGDLNVAYVPIENRP